MSAPRVSIIVPFLDPPPGFFEEAVASVKAQSFSDWELLLVNDGSGSEARAMAEAFAAGDPRRIRCLQHEGGVNRGIPTTRNLGLTHAQGELIAYLDSDDAWYPHKLSDQVRIMDARRQVDMVFGRSLSWYTWAGSQAGGRSDEPPPLRVPDRRELGRGEFIRSILLARVMVPCPSSILVRAAAARAVGGFQEDISNLYEDQAFYAKISLGGAVLPCADVWDRYRIHSGSVCSTASRRQSMAARRQFLEWLGRYLDKLHYDDTELRAALRLETWATWIPAGPRMLRTMRRMSARPNQWLQEQRNVAS
jgi:glycosyltransferase involved in cell wall biosynthesis